MLDIRMRYPIEYIYTFVCTFPQPIVDGTKFGALLKFKLNALSQNVVNAMDSFGTTFSGFSGEKRPQTLLFSRRATKNTNVYAFLMRASG